MVYGASRISLDPLEPDMENKTESFNHATSSCYYLLAIVSGYYFIGPRIASKGRRSSFNLQLPCP